MYCWDLLPTASLHDSEIQAAGISEELELPAQERILPKCKGHSNCGKKSGEPGTPSLNKRLLGVVGAAARDGGQSLWTQ